MSAMPSLDVNTDSDAFSEPEVIVDTHKVKIVQKSNDTTCNQEHVRQFDESKLTSLGEHQMHIKGTHKCCQCAYNSGYEQGALLQVFISLDVRSLGDAHPDKNGHYKSIHQAFALGYSDGVNSFIKS